MPLYRVFTLCPSGSVTSPGRDFEAESDADSVAHVEDTLDDGDKSIWQGTRLVAEIDHRTKRAK